MSRLPRKQAITVGDALLEMFRSSRASATHNSHRVFEAWNEASGAGQYTIRRYYRDGVLYITMKSSVLATQLGMQKAFLLEKVNAILRGDSLFIKDEPHAGYVKEIRIK